MSSTFTSLALQDIPDPDFADMAIAVLPAHATADPGAWARSLFSAPSLPRWLRMSLRLTRLGTAHRDQPFDIRRVVDDEALVALDDRRVDFRAAVGIDEATALVRIVTAVRLKGRLGRLPVAPLRIAQLAVLHSMLRRSQRRLSGVTR